MMEAQTGGAASRYSLFGLQIDSALALPELLPGDGTAPADVTIEMGEVAVEDHFEAGVPQVTAEGTVLVIEQTAKYLVSEGARIVIDPLHGASDRNVRLFLLGSVFALLIHQRGLLPLHANGVEIDGKVVAFTGQSGAGKSTLAAWFSDKGFPLIADDVTVVDVHDDVATVLPGLPRLRLWSSVIAATGRDPEHFKFSVEGQPSYDKRDVLLSSSKLVSEPRRLAAVVELTRSGSGLRALKGVAAAETILSHTYRGEYIPTLQMLEEHFTTCARLVRAVPVFQVCVDFDLADLDSSYEPLLQRVRELVTASSRAG